VSLIPKTESPDYKFLNPGSRDWKCNPGIAITSVQFAPIAAHIFSCYMFQFLQQVNFYAVTRICASALQRVIFGFICVFLDFDFAV